jgi:hypothetical protein
MARDAPHLHDVSRGFSNLASERVVDVTNHFHHDSSRLLCLFFIGSRIERKLSVWTRLRACLLGMTIVATHTKSHRELLHDLHDLLARPIFRQHLKIRRRRTSTTSASATTPITTTTAATRRLLSAKRHGRQQANHHHSEGNETAITHMHLEFRFQAGIP